MPRFITEYALRFASQTRRIMSSNAFFYGTVILFVLEAGWIALTAVYPQAFDEQFHLGIMKLYAHQWSPFFTHQPAGADMYGAVARDPSYMYHYLMSFPYRLIAHFTSNLPTQVILLRTLNIALLASGLFVFRRVLRSVPLTKPQTHLILLVYVLVPVMPLLGAQINYDNALIPLVGLSVLWTVRLLRTMRDERRLPLLLILKLLALCLFTSLVKYAFLPFFMAIVVLFLVQAVRSRLLTKTFFQKSLTGASRLSVAMTSIAVTVSAGLFIAMYGVNLARYHTPVPDCSVVIGQQACLKYPPWGRDFTLSHGSKPTTGQILKYPAAWVHQSINELTFAIASNFEADGVTVDYYSAPPLPVIVGLAWGILAVGVIAVTLYARRLWEHIALRTFLTLSIVYIGILFVQNFLEFLKTGQPVAIHGRYILPVLPLLLAATAKCIVWFVQRQKVSVRRALYTGQLWLAVLGIILMIQGGGFITYIVRSDPDWLWPQNSSIHKVNHAAKKVLHPVVVGSKRPSG